MDDHLDVHPDDFPAQLPAVGTVTGVYPKDHADNPTQTVTLYQVTLHLQRPATEAVLPFVPYLDQSAGGTNVSEDPLLVGQMVVVAFLEGDPNRPYIQGLWFDHDTTVAETVAEHPQIQKRQNGLVSTIDKDGNKTIALAPGRDLTITISNGNVLLEVKWMGLAYEVHLGGDTGLKELITEALIVLYDAHVHTGGTFGGGFTGVPTVPLTGVTTNITKAK